MRRRMDKSSLLICCCFCCLLLMLGYILVYGVVDGDGGVVVVKVGGYVGVGVEGKEFVG